MNIHLSVVIPAYNESESFKRGVLDEVHQYLEHQGYSFEVIVVDDGSNDGSVSLFERYIQRKPSWKLIKNPHLGKAQTVATGVQAAQGALVLYTDFDQATPITEIEKLFPFIDKGYDLVIGSREVKGSKRENEPWYRHAMGRVFNLLVNLVAIRGIHDTQCGFKLFKTKAAKRLFSRLIVYRTHTEKAAFTGAFDVELLYLAQKWNLRIAEVPVYWTHVPTTRVSPIRDSLRMFLDLVGIRWADLTGKYSKG